MIEILEQRGKDREIELERLVQRHAPRRVSPLPDEPEREVKRDRLEELQEEAAYQRERYKLSKRGEEKKREKGKALRQEQMLASLRMIQLGKGRDVVPLTVEQIVYRLGLGSASLCDKDLFDMCERGLVTRSEGRNRNRKRVWAYKVVP